MVNKLTKLYQGTPLKTGKANTLILLTVKEPLIRGGGIFKLNRIRTDTTYYTGDNLPIWVIRTNDESELELRKSYSAYYGDYCRNQGYGGSFYFGGGYDTGSKAGLWYLNHTSVPGAGPNGVRLSRAPLD